MQVQIVINVKADKFQINEMVQDLTEYVLEKELDMIDLNVDDTIDINVVRVKRFKSI